MNSITDQIKSKARDIGFHKVGIAQARALWPESQRLAEWLAHGFNGEMRWMEREPEKRSDPRLIFPDARSVVSLALNYYTPHEHVDTDPSKGKISRYAWGDDYHDVVREKLTLLLDWVKAEIPGADGKIYVDTAPIMDKAWAARSGIGWIGKSSNLITKDYGSWVFLGEILLNINLDYDETIGDHCGSCTACLDACPTGAIVQPYVVDSTRCLSYATIELRGDEMPQDVASKLDGWLYGCDVCQDVCPWNRFEKPTDESRFEPRDGETVLELREVNSMTHEEYVERFRRTAIKRAKLSGLQRNARALLSSASGQTKA